jgi:hypothetical protein
MNWPGQIGMNWPGLLAWSTKYQDGTGPPEFRTMSEEDREFITNALRRCVAPRLDTNQVMGKAITKLREAMDPPDEAVLLTALEVMNYNDTDVAENLEQLGGLAPLLELAAFPGKAVRDRALELLAVMLANNAGVQSAAVAHGAVGALLRQVAAAPSPRAVSALSALVKHHGEAEEAFVEQDGVRTVATLLGGEVRTAQKCATLLRVLVENARIDEHARGVAELAQVYTPARFELEGEIQAWEIFADLAVALADRGARVEPGVLQKRIDFAQPRPACSRPRRAKFR